MPMIILFSEKTDLLLFFFVPLILHAYKVNYITKDILIL
jgi:hypothetical protein